MGEHKDHKPEGLIRELAKDPKVKGLIKMTAIALSYPLVGNLSTNTQRMIAHHVGEENYSLGEAKLTGAISSWLGFTFGGLALWQHYSNVVDTSIGVYTVLGYGFAFGAIRAQFGGRFPGLIGKILSLPTDVYCLFKPPKKLKEEKSLFYDSPGAGDIC